MPRDGQSIYTYPPGTEGIPDTTIEGGKYNVYIADVADDLNRPRPILAGGTGSSSATGAIKNLGAEKASQVVNNYNTHIWFPGSFYSAIGAVGAPPAPAGQVATHAFVGWVVSSDPLPVDPALHVNRNVVVHARDQNDLKVPGTVYVREKKVDATHPDGLWGPWAIDGGGLASPTPPLTPADGTLWWDNISGQLYIWYRDVDSAAWVIASPSPDPAQFLLKAGDTMTGTLGLAAPPVADLDAANKKYVDDADAALRQSMQDDIIPVLDDKVDVAGDVMTGALTVTYGTTPTTGAIYFGNSGNQALSYNGSAFVFTSDLYVNRNGAPADGLIYFGNTGTRYIYQTGGSFNFTGGISSAGGIFCSGALQTNNTFSAAGASTFGSTLQINNDVTITRAQQGSPSQGLLFFGNSGGMYLYLDAGNAQYNFVGGGVVANAECYKPGGGPWGSGGSDARIKNVLGSYTHGLNEIKQLTPQRYTFKGNDVVGEEATGVSHPEQKAGGPNPRSRHFGVAERKDEFVGLIAQDVEGVMPEMVKKIAGKIDGQDVSDYRRLDSNALTYALINAVKELAARVEALEGK